ncbi:MAG: response regulator [Beijerinckiaceae bacterium]|nr:response regulator [Beijerinckiaceae bacterium]
MIDALQNAAPAPAPADNAAHLLIVDDDRRIRELLRRYLVAGGYRVTTAGNAAEATTAMRNMSFDLIVLDVMMPGEDGFSFASRLRGDTGAGAQIPILMLTAKTEFEERVLGFEIGVDDYLGKPFEPRELSLRIASILRRAKPPEDAGVPAQVHFGPFVFDLERGELRENGELVRITEREREMLRLLAAQTGATVSREALSGTGGAGNERTIDVQVNRLRRKIERDPANPLYLQTARGAGYRLLVDR